MYTLQLPRLSWGEVRTVACLHARLMGYALVTPEIHEVAGMRGLGS